MTDITTVTESYLSARRKHRVAMEDAKGAAWQSLDKRLAVGAAYDRMAAAQTAVQLEYGSEYLLALTAVLDAGSKFTGVLVRRGILMPDQLAGLGEAVGAV